MVISEMPIEVLTTSFREFYERDPWNEYLRCPVCNPFDNFGSPGRYEDSTLSNCPVCDSTLEPYWSEDRVKHYFLDAVNRPGFVGVVGKNGSGEIVAWTWGYHISEIPELSDLEQNGIYVDIIGVLPEYRDDSLAVFIEGHAIGIERGYKYFVTRTHVKAEYVHRAMTAAGYSFLRRSCTEQDREYWRLIP
jgi:hypothetical protein